MSTSVNLPPYGNEFTSEGAVLSTLKAAPQPDPDMTVYVAPGGVWVNGRNYIEWEGGNSGTFTAPGANARWDLLVLNSSGYLQIVTGTAAASPELPAAPRNVVVLAAVYLQTTTTIITTENLFDLRPVINNSMFSHRDVEDKDASDQHPISAVTDLQTTLDAMPTTTDMNTALANKADTDGTPDVTFTMNSDEVGAPSSDVTIEVERGTGSNVNIRWNEDVTPYWDYTDDGSTRYKFQADLFVSTEQTGTGSEQTIAHGLGRTPTSVFVSITDDNSGAGFTITEGSHDGTNVAVTVTDSAKYKVLAF